MTSWLDRADHTADDFEDFALPGEGAANERAAVRDGDAARSMLRPVDVSTVTPPTHGRRHSDD